MPASPACRFIQLRFREGADRSMLEPVVQALASGLYRIDRTANFASPRPTSTVTLVRTDLASDAVSIEIETGRRVYEGSGMDAAAFALSVLSSPELPQDVLEDMKTVMRAAGRSVCDALTTTEASTGRRRMVSIWVHAPLGALTASNSIGNGLFSPDPPLDETLLVLPAVADVEITSAHEQDEGEDTAPVRIPASIRIERLREFAGSPPDDPMQMLRRMERLRSLANPNSDRKVP